jgi:hypothetical protein
VLRQHPQQPDEVAGVASVGDRVNDFFWRMRLHEAAQGVKRARKLAAFVWLQLMLSGSGRQAILRSICTAKIFSVYCL